MNTYGLFQPNKLLAAMVGVSLVVHILLWLLLSRIDLVATTPAPLADVVELLLVDDEELVPAPDPDADDASQPREVVLIPEDHATQAPPEQADFLAEFNSQAADLIPGGTSDSGPGARRESEAPMVALERERLDAAEAVPVQPSVIQPPTPSQPRPEPEEVRPGAEPMPSGEVPTAEVEPTDDSDATAAEPDRTAEPAESSEYEQWLAEQRSPSLMNQGDRGFDFDQLEGGDVRANVDIVGGYRLNTYEWNFVPWIRRFANDLQRAWIPPYAYRSLGMIHGKTEVRVVVERDGTPSRMDIMSKEGHESLHKASLNALQACAPYLPLPPDFPKSQLVIVFTLIYPEWPR